MLLLLLLLLLLLFCGECQTPVSAPTSTTIRSRYASLTTSMLPSTGPDKAIGQLLLTGSCCWPGGSSSQFKQTVALLKAKTDSYLGSRLKQTVALLTANTDSYLGSQPMSRLSQHCVNDVEMVVVANGKEKCAKCITQWICCTTYKAEAVCNPDEYSLATLQTAKKEALRCCREGVCTTHSSLAGNFYGAGNYVFAIDPIWQRTPRKLLTTIIRGEGVGTAPELVIPLHLHL
jgi:hypothetical protein